MKNTEIESNNALKNIIAPMGLNFEKNSLTIGENEAKVYGVISYPQSGKLGWLSSITNIPSTYVNIGIEPIDSAELLTSLNKNIRMDKERAETEKNEV